MRLSKAAVAAAAGLSAVSVVFLHWVLRRERRRRGRKLPGPRPLPMLGNLHQLSARRLHLCLEEMSRQFGKTFEIWLGTQRVVVSSDLSATRFVLTNRPQLFDRPANFGPVLRDLSAYGTFGLNDEEWRRRRPFAAKAFTTPQVKRAMGDISERCRDLRERVLRMKGAPCDVNRLLKESIMSILLKIAFGQDIAEGDGQAEGEGGVPGMEARGEGEGDVTMRDFENAVAVFGKWFLAPFAYWRYFPNTEDRRALESVKKIVFYVKNLIKKKREDRANKEGDLGQQPQQGGGDLLDALIDATSEDEGGAMNDEELIHEVVQFLFAGHDTTAGSLAWQLWFLALKPELQSKARREATEVLGVCGIPDSLDSLQKLKLIGNMTKETLRLRSAAPIIGSVAKEDIKDLPCELSTTSTSAQPQTQTDGVLSEELSSSLEKQRQHTAETHTNGVGDVGTSWGVGMQGKGKEAAAAAESVRVRRGDMVIVLTRALMADVRAHARPLPVSLSLLSCICTSASSLCLQDRSFSLFLFMVVSLLSFSLHDTYTA